MGNEQSPENKAVIQSELPSMDSTIEGGTLESIDLSAITPAGALVLHPSQSTLNPTASEWMPRFGSVSEDLSDNGLDFEEAVSDELILPAEEESEGTSSEEKEIMCNLCQVEKPLFCYTCSINLSTLPGEKGFLTTIKTPQMSSLPNCPKCC